MKTKLFVPHKLALKLKEKAFPNNTGSCLAAWEDTKDAQWLHFGAHPVGLLQAPLYQQAVDWLRDEKHIWIDVRTDFYYGTALYIATIKGGFEPIELECFGYYYESLEDAIEEALKKI